MILFYRGSGDFLKIELKVSGFLCLEKIGLKKMITVIAKEESWNNYRNQATLVRTSYYVGFIWGGGI